MEFRLINELAMDEATDRAIREGLCVCFPMDAEVFRRTRAWHGSAPAFTALIEDGGMVLAHLGVVNRTILAGGQPVRVAGVQNVFVRPERRGEGLVDQILRESMAEASRRGMDAGLLFCVPGIVKVYARNGWQLLPPRAVHATRSSGERYLLDDKNVLMFHPLARRTFPDGAIDLNGDDW